MRQLEIGCQLPTAKEDPMVRPAKKGCVDLDLKLGATPTTALSHIFRPQITTGAFPN